MKLAAGTCDGWRAAVHQIAVSVKTRSPPPSKVKTRRQKVFDPTYVHTSSTMTTADSRRAGHRESKRGETRESARPACEGCAFADPQPRVRRAVHTRQRSLEIWAGKLKHVDRWRCRGVQDCVARGRPCGHREDGANLRRPKRQNPCPVVR